MEASLPSAVIAPPPGMVAPVALPSGEAAPDFAVLLAGLLGVEVAAEGPGKPPGDPVAGDVDVQADAVVMVSPPVLPDPAAAMMSAASVFAMVMSSDMATALPQPASASPPDRVPEGMPEASPGGDLGGGLGGVLGGGLGLALPSTTAAAATVSPPAIEGTEPSSLPAPAGPVALEASMPAAATAAAPPAAVLPDGAVLPDAAALAAPAAAAVAHPGEPVATPAAPAAPASTMPAAASGAPPAAMPAVPPADAVAPGATTAAETARDVPPEPALTAPPPGTVPANAASAMVSAATVTAPSRPAPRPATPPPEGAITEAALLAEEAAPGPTIATPPPAPPAATPPIPVAASAPPRPLDPPTPGLREERRVAAAEAGLPQAAAPTAGPLSPAPAEAAPPAAARPAAPIPWPARQVVPFAVSLALGSDDSISLTLEPLELGRVEVAIARGAEAHVSLRAERPETLALLQRDRAELERALANVGLGGEGRSPSLSFGLGTNAGGEDRRDRRQASRDPGSLRPAAAVAASGPIQAAASARGLIDLAI